MSAQWFAGKIPESSAIARAISELDGLIPESHKRYWREQILSKLPITDGGDRAWAKVAIWLLQDPQHGVLQHANTKIGKYLVNQVGELYFHGAAKSEFEKVSEQALAIARDQWQIGHEGSYFAIRTAAHAAFAALDHAGLAAALAVESAWWTWQIAQFHGWPIVACDAVLEFMNEVHK